MGWLNRKKSKTANFKPPVAHLMEQLPRINVSLGRKVNIGNYESVDYHASLSIDVKPGIPIPDALDSANMIVETAILRFAESNGIHLENLTDQGKFGGIPK